MLEKFVFQAKRCTRWYIMLLQKSSASSSVVDSKSCISWITINKKGNTFCETTIQPFTCLRLSSRLKVYFKMNVDKKRMKLFKILEECFLFRFEYTKKLYEGVSFQPVYELLLEDHKWINQSHLVYQGIS